MKKLMVLCLLLLALTSLAQVGRRLPLGWVHNPQTSSATLSLSGSTTYLGYSLLQTGTKNISSVKFRVFSVTGTLTSISCELHPDSSGVPSGTSLETSTISSGLPTGASTITFNFAGSTSMTDGNIYWLVLKNLTANPMTNYPTYVFLAAALPSSAASVAVPGWAEAKTTDGLTWTNTNTQVGGYLIGYSDGTYDGSPTYAKAGDRVNKAFGSNEVGVQFTSPANTTLNVRGITMATGGKVGSPTGNLTYKMYFGASPTLKATSVSMPAPQVSGLDQIYMTQFSRTVQILPNTVVTITLKDSAADNSNNYYQIMTFPILDTTAGTLSTLPWGGTPVEAVYNGTSWFTNVANFIEFSLLLDPTTPF